MKHILITGATSGIGKALAILCSERGYRVTACGRNAEALKELAALNNVEVLQFDVSDDNEVHRNLAHLNPDICVLNAGVCEYVDCEDIQPAMFRRVFEANFFGVINCISVLQPNLQPGSQVVMVDSLARLLPFSRSQAYGASKVALHYFSKSLEVDLSERGVIVQSVSPGFVATPLTDKNDFSMPMLISDKEAVVAMLKGIEKRHSSIYFPWLFSFILRALSILPNRAKVIISKTLKNNHSTGEVVE